MSATLDSDLLAQYFGNCQVLAAGGRTHPVEQFFLEDVFELTEYRLDSEGPAALRPTAAFNKNKALQKASASKQGLVKVQNSFLLYLYGHFQNGLAGCTYTKCHPWRTPC